ncbi:MAG TPA: DUF6125 family protein [Verrucomicrobiae bacterium]
MAHRSGLTPEQVEDYLYHTYTRVDGLWFVLVEERYGFEAALALDEAVWKVIPKIQARQLRKQLNLTLDPAGLNRALAAKLSLDRYEFDLHSTPAGIDITLSTCPWHDLIVRSGRGHLAERIGGVICGVEFSAFAREFGCSCSPPPGQRLCRDGAACRFHFAPLPQAGRTAPEPTFSA